MKIHKQIEPLLKSSAIALGYFDGVHTAHQKVISAARDFNLNTVVLTFSLNRAAPENKKKDSIIYTDKQKMLFFKDLGVNDVFSPDFFDIADITAENFFYEILLKKLNAKALSCGFDYTFGRYAQGNVAMLKELCCKNKILLTVIPEQKIEGISVSSSVIRESIASGDMKSAAKLLGRNYTIVGTVVHGRSLGHTLGFPTINQQFEAEQILPEFGVYKSRVMLHGEWKKAITNVGIKPTIEGHRLPLAETYILDISENLYGQELTVELLELTRKEQKFDSVEELKKTVLQDIKNR